MPSNIYTPGQYWKDAEHLTPYHYEELGGLFLRHGFEIVDKRSGKELFLEGSWAEQFQAHLRAWQENSPTQEEVEDTLAGYAELAQNPLVVH